MPRAINLTGKPGVTYDLEELRQNTRTGSGELLVQVWKWNPNLPKSNPHSKPNPPDLKLGQIWMSRRVEVGTDEYKELLSSGEA